MHRAWAAAGGITRQSSRRATRKSRRSTTGTTRRRSIAYRTRPRSPTRGRTCVRRRKPSRSQPGWAQRNPGRVAPAFRFASCGLQERHARSPLVDRIDPRHLLGLLHRLDVEVDDDRLVVAAHQHAFERLVRAGVDLLVRHERRHVDEVAGPGLGHELEVLAPAHARSSAHHVDDAFQFAVVMRPGLGVGLGAYGSGPDLLRADARVVDRRLAVHAGRLRRVGIERGSRDHADAIVLPFGHLYSSDGDCSLSRRRFACRRSGVSKPSVNHAYCGARSSRAARNVYYWPRFAALAKRRASSAARNRALALFTHSSCSKAGSESATMPAPACT